MKEAAKLLIAYDGSPCSDAALNDLQRAGLPLVGEAIVVTVADIILPPPDEELPADDTGAVHIPEVEHYAEVRAQKAMHEAQAFAERAVKRVKTDFPGWSVRSDTSCDAPAWAVLRLADNFNPSLIIVGSHDHSLIGGRLIWGSVSQRVLYEARCSVRVARSWNEERTGPVRIMIGFNGSQDSEAAVDAVASREWPEGSEARLITAHHELSFEARDAAAASLQAVGLSTTAFSRDGDAAHVLIREAEEWEADSIFVGTRDVHGFQHVLHGSVSAAVAAHARCSVEVARASKRAG